MNIFKTYSCRKLILVSAAIGILARLLISPFLTDPNDVSTWGTIIEYLRAGESLYDIRGFYYTPPWGYILELIAVICNILPGIGELTAKPSEMLFLRDYGCWGTVSSPYFNFIVKLPLIAIDIALAYCIYLTIYHVTNDERKGAIGFAIWALAPPAIIISGINGMFDNLAGLFLVLCLLGLLQKRNCLAGMALAVSVMTKFFPIACIVAIIPYVWITGQNRLKEMARFIGSFIATSVILIIPQIARGQIAQTFHFVIFRLNDNGASESITPTGWALIFTGIVALAFGTIIVAYTYNKCSEPSKVLLTVCAILMAGIVIVQYRRQYLAQVLPLFIILWVAYSYKLQTFALLLSTAIVLIVICELPLVLASTAYYTELVSIEWVENTLVWENSNYICQIIDGYGNKVTKLLLLIISAICFTKLVWPNGFYLNLGRKE